VLRGGGQVEIEIEASARIVPQTNLITSPDRLIVDFVNATPGAQLRNQVVNRKEVKSMRVGLFSSNPPVTRVVFDLNGPQPYQVFPSGKTIIVKVGTPGAEAARVNPVAEPELVSITYPPSDAPISTPTPAPAPLPPPKPRLVVSFRNGLLSINSDQASLSEVLFAVHQRTGAEIPIPAGAEQEKVVVQLGPAPAPEVLAHLLNGTKFNFLILSSASNPRDLDQVILSPRGEGALSGPSPQLQPMAVEDERTMQPNAVPPPQPEPPPTAENPNPPADGQAPQPPPPNENPN
jgi:AMIN domain